MCCAFLFLLFDICFNLVMWHKRDIEHDNYSAPPHDSTTAWMVPHLNFAGLADIQHGIFVREETRNLWTTLEGLGVENGQKRGVWISGPPGVGKSTEVYAWGMYRAKHIGSERCNMLWVHQSSESYEIVKIVDGSMVGTTMKNIDEIVDMCEGLDIIIFDAVRSGMKNLVLEALDKFQNAVIVACTSYQSGSINQELWAKYQPIFNFDYTVYSWTWEQYVEAHEAGVFGEIDLDMLQEKFYCCGGCIRLMTRRLDDIVHYFAKKLGEVNEKSVLLGGLGGVSSPAAVNSLVSVRPSDEATDMSYVVSQYVSRKLSLVVEDSFMAKMQFVNGDNPAWQGWVFEFRLLHNLRRMMNTGEALNLLSLDEASCPALNVLINSVLIYSGPENPKKPFNNNTLFIPEKWNQGCFDAVYFHENDAGKRCFEFLNATIAESHIFKCQHMANFLHWAIGTPAAREPAHNDVKVTLYAVTSLSNRNRFNLNTCKVVDHISILNYDPSFSPEPAQSRVLQVLHTGGLF